MIKWPPRERLTGYLLWGACGLTVAAAAATLLFPLGGGTNRIAGGALPLALAAAACAALAFWSGVDRWLSLVFYAVVALAITYGLMVVGSLPLRLTVIGTCPSPPLACPVGFEPAMTGGESIGLDVAVALGVVALIAALASMELRYRPRLRVIGRPRSPAGAVAASPSPPEMKPSAIPKKPAREPINTGSSGESRD